MEEYIEVIQHGRKNLSVLFHLSVAWVVIVFTTTFLFWFYREKFLLAFFESISHSIPFRRWRNNLLWVGLPASRSKLFSSDLVQESNKEFSVLCNVPSVWLKAGTDHYSICKLPSSSCSHHRPTSTGKSAQCQHFRLLAFLSDPI